MSQAYENIDIIYFTTFDHIFFQKSIDLKRNNKKKFFQTFNSLFITSLNTFHNVPYIEKFNVKQNNIKKKFSIIEKFSRNIFNDVSLQIFSKKFRFKRKLY